MPYVPAKRIRLSAGTAASRSRTKASCTANASRSFSDRVDTRTSSLFVLSVFLLSRGLSYLWRVPENDSWLVLVGIAGHGFISTALLAASFVYYRNMSAWLDTVYERYVQVGGRSPAKKL